MATRANQIEILAAGVLFDGATIATPYAKFYAAGTTTAKDAYADVDKTVAITKKALDTQGRAIVYGDGIYKIRIYSGDPDAGGVLKFEIDNYKVTAAAGNTRTVTATTVTGTVDDSLVVANTTSNNIAYYLPDAALMAGKLLQTAKSVAANTLTVYPKSGSGQLVNGAASVAYTAINSTGVFQSDGSNWYVFQTVGDATSLTSYKLKVLEIGDWNMDTTAAVVVASGLPDYLKVRSISALIYADGGGTPIDLLSSNGAGTGDSYVAITSGENIQLSRLDGGKFDAAGYSATSFNRGWITIWYID